MANPRKVAYAELESLVGQEVGVSDWHTIDQARINLFADATGDHQWIHVDEESQADDGLHHRPRLPHALAAPDARR